MGFSYVSIKRNPKYLFDTSQNMICVIYFQMNMISTKPLIDAMYIGTNIKFLQNNDQLCVGQVVGFCVSAGYVLVEWKDTIVKSKLSPEQKKQKIVLLLSTEQKSILFIVI